MARVLPLLLLALAGGCQDELSPAWIELGHLAEPRSPGGTATPATTPHPSGIRTWRSWDTVLLPSPKYAAVLDTGGLFSMDVVLFEGMGAPLSTGGSGFDTLLAAGTFPDPLEGLGAWRSVSGSSPYVGKSASARGAGDVGAPSPLGVYDLQFHAPPGAGNFATAAFVVPTAGTYSISGLSFRLVRGDGDGAYLRVIAYNPEPSQIAVSPVIGIDWNAYPAIPAVTLTAGDTILVCVGPGPGGEAIGDAVEVAFSIEKRPAP